SRRGLAGPHEMARTRRGLAPARLTAGAPASPRRPPRSRDRTTHGEQRHQAGATEKGGEQRRAERRRDRAVRRDVDEDVVLVEQDEPATGDGQRRRDDGSEPVAHAAAGGTLHVLRAGLLAARLALERLGQRDARGLRPETIEIVEPSDRNLED